MKQLLICDLDNTLYDWVGYFVPAFYAMVDEAVRITDCDRETLLDDLRAVHRRHHNAEHPFALLECETMRRIFSGKSPREIKEALDPAFHAFNASRKEKLRLFPGVHETLRALIHDKVILVAHTESQLYAVVDRMTRLDLIPFFRRIYCRARGTTAHPIPDVGERWLNRFPMEKIVELSHHQRKPDPDVLLEICSAEYTAPSEAAYVGDSIARDILMARSAGVFAIWAKYGASSRDVLYDRLVRISHWTSSDVERERRLQEQAQGINPDFILADGFGELVDVLPRTSRQGTASTAKLA